MPNHGIGLESEEQMKVHYTASAYGWCERYRDNAVEVTLGETWVEIVYEKLGKLCTENFYLYSEREKIGYIDPGDVLIHDLYVDDECVI